MNHFHRLLSLHTRTLRCSSWGGLLYRNSDLRRIIEEHRARGKEAHTLSGLTTEIAHLRIALDAIATTVRRQEEELRRLRKTQR
jgi:hypothetical protein